MSRIKAMRDSDKEDFRRFELRFQETVTNKGSNRPQGQVQAPDESIILPKIIHNFGHEQKPQREKRVPKTKPASQKSIMPGWGGFEDSELGRKSAS